MNEYSIKEIYDYFVRFIVLIDEGEYFPHEYIPLKGKSKRILRQKFNKIKFQKLNEFKTWMTVLERTNIVNGLCPRNDVEGFCYWLTDLTAINHKTKKRKYFLTAIQKLTIVYNEIKWELYFAFFHWYKSHKEELIKQGLVKENK